MKIRPESWRIMANRAAVDGRHAEASRMFTRAARAYNRRAEKWGFAARVLAVLTAALLLVRILQSCAAANS